MRVIAIWEIGTHTVRSTSKIDLSASKIGMKLAFKVDHSY